MTKVKTTDNTISINEACQQAGITRMTFYNWLKKGIPVKTYKQLNKQVLLDRNDWDKYLNILISGLSQARGHNAE